MKKNKGFSLIELMVTLSVAAIIMAMAVPAAQTIQANTRVSSAASDLATDLKKIRGEAIITRRNLNFVPSSSAWNNQGWKATTTVNGQVTTVLQRENLPSTVTIVETSSNQNIGFLGSTGMTDAAVDINFRICDNSTNLEKGYDVMLNRFGRVLIKRHADSVVCNP